MKLLTLLLLLLLSLPMTVSARKCTGSANCRVCTNCSRCQYCNSGGTCGVCSGGSSKHYYPAPTYTPTPPKPQHSTTSTPSTPSQKKQITTVTKPIAPKIDSAHIDSTSISHLENHDTQTADHHNTSNVGVPIFLTILLIGGLIVFIVKMSK